MTNGAWRTRYAPGKTSITLAQCQTDSSVVKSGQKNHSVHQANATLRRLHLQEASHKYGVPTGPICDKIAPGFSNVRGKYVRALHHNWHFV